MLKQRILAYLLVISLIAGTSGAPALADSESGVVYAPSSEETTATGNPTSTQDQGGEAIGNDDPAEDPESSESAAPEIAEPDAGSGATMEDAEQDDDNLQDNNTVNEPDRADSDGLNQPYNLPKILPKSKPSPLQGGGKDTAVIIDENVGATIDSQANAKTGQGEAIGTQSLNAIGGSARAIALAGSGETVTPSLDGAFADNAANKSIDSSGTALAHTGLAKAGNLMDGNTARISPDTTVTVDVAGNIINSNVVVKVLFNYWAEIVGLASAVTGDSGAYGLLADNSINSDDKALAKGDATTTSSGGIYDGSALSGNDTQNSIKNTGTAHSSTGEAEAANIMQGNDIIIAPAVKALVEICSDIIDSNVTINLIYNFAAAIAGLASADSGDSKAVGADVGNQIDNYSSAKAVGDAPLRANGSSYSDGSAVASNDTVNSISNKGEGLSVSGDTKALNNMVNNDINIAPVVTSQISLLDAIINAEVEINLIYNFNAAILGESIAKTGDSFATGLDADNSINNMSSATALGDSAKPIMSDTGGHADGEAHAFNDTSNSIDNIGDAVSASGNANANNTMLDNFIDLSPVIETVVMVVRPIVDNLVIIDIIYEIGAKLLGSANATAGDAASAGTVTISAIKSKSEADAVAKVTKDKPDGSANAFNSSDNQIGNNGFGVAYTGDVSADSMMNEALVVITPYLKDDIIADGLLSSIVNDSKLNAEVSEIAVAKTGEAIALGSYAESYMKSTAVSKDIFGNGGFAINESDDDIFNDGQAFAITEAASAKSGKLTPNNTENKAIIGTALVDAEKADSSPEEALVAGSENRSLEDPSSADNSSDASDLTAPDGSNGSGTDDQSGQDASDPYAGLNRSYADITSYGDSKADGQKTIDVQWWIWMVLLCLVAGCIDFLLSAKLRKSLRR